MSTPSTVHGERRALSSRRCLLLFTKPAHPGRVKTRLVGELSARQTARLHAAFVGDLGERLGGGPFYLKVAWALEEGEDFPRGLMTGQDEDVRQAEGDLGARLHSALAAAAAGFETVAAVGSDYPDLELATVEEAFRRLESGADAVFGPTADGGYYLIGLGRHAVRRELFEGVAWSTGAVFSESMERCERLGLDVAILPRGHDVDVADDLRQLASRLTAGEGSCLRTRALLEQWGWLGAEDRGTMPV